MTCPLQSLEPSEEDQSLALKLEEDSKEVLMETCPPEFVGLQEQDVRHGLCGNV